MPTGEPQPSSANATGRSHVGGPGSSAVAHRPMGLLQNLVGASAFQLVLHEPLRNARDSRSAYADHDGAAGRGRRARAQTTASFHMAGPPPGRRCADHSGMGALFGLLCLVAPSRHLVDAISLSRTAGAPSAGYIRRHRPLATRPCARTPDRCLRPAARHAITTPALLSDGLCSSPF